MACEDYEDEGNSLDVAILVTDGRSAAGVIAPEVPLDDNAFERARNIVTTTTPLDAGEFFLPGQGILLHRFNDPATVMTYRVATSGPLTHLFVGLLPQGRYQVKLNGEPFLGGLFAATAEGTLVFRSLSGGTFQVHLVGTS